jgi:hypothetical protein
MDPQIPQPFDLDSWQRENNEVDLKNLEAGNDPESEYLDGPEQRINRHDGVSAKRTSLASQSAPFRNFPFAHLFIKGG